MNKLLFLSMFFCFALVCHAQDAPRLRNGLKMHQAVFGKKTGVEPVKAATPSPNYISNQNYRSPNAVQVVDIGTSCNAYGYGYEGGQRSIICYNKDINAITNIHRMGGALDPDGYSGDLGYDLSLDGGKTWTCMIETYLGTPPGPQYYADGARFPQAVIFNPEGNTNPSNASLAFFAPNLDATNGAWGGYCYGTHKITSASNVDTTENLLFSSAPYFQYIPDGMDINRKTGTVLVADMNQNWTTGSFEYLGQLIISRGTWSDEENDIIYERMLIDAPVANPEEQLLPACVRVAYSPDGSVAWIVILADNGGNEAVVPGQKTYYPILYKSVDDGLTWSEPMNIQLDGPNGIEGVKTYLTAVQWDSLFADPDPQRDEVPFTMAFDCDLVVDIEGNPHIAVGIGVAGNEPYSIITEYPYFALMDIHSTDRGETWEAVEIGRPHNFRGTFGELSEDNRICAATNWDGTKVFFSYLDTDPEVNPEDNNSPDIWARGFDPMANMMTADGQGEDMPTNVTFGSVAMWQSYFGTMASFVIQDDDSYTLPLVYEEMDNADPTKPVQYRYIKDFIFTEADFALPTGPIPVVADFSASDTVVYEVSTVYFNDLSDGATSWLWEFEGGYPTMSTEQNPSVFYADEGQYDVRLIASNDEDQDTLTKEDYIRVDGNIETYMVTFNADANRAIEYDVFIYGVDTMYVTGSMIGWLEPGYNGSLLMTDDDGDSVFTATIELPAGEYQYKYFKNAGWEGGEWCGDPGREFRINGDNLSLDDIFGGIYIGIEDFESRITISPNPANNYFRIAADRDYTIEVMDLSGRLVTTVQMLSNEVIINMENQEAGVYIVRMANEKTTFFKKIIKK